MAEDEQHQGMHPSFIGVIRQKERLRQKLANIKHKICIYSAKGGVGKTTIAVNIAYALKERGFRVGILDADIDTPNVALFLGINDKFDTSTMPLKPIIKDSVKVASTAMLMQGNDRPIIWRGPMIVKMLGEFFENTDWGELDYLIIDLSPGTSDAPLTIMQVLELDGFIMVTTPQRIAAINSIKSGIMARKLNAPILGIVENMSDGNASDTTKDAVKALNTEFLGSIKLDSRFNELSDYGKIPVLEDKKFLEEFGKIIDRIIGK